MIRIPHTYAEWNEVLAKYKAKEDDADVLQAMQQGTIEWQSGVAERFSKKLMEATNARLNAASDKFQRDMNHSKGSEGGLVKALLDLRKELSFLSKAVSLPAIPEEQRRQFVKIVRDQADQVQKSLEDSAKQDRTGKLSSIIRNHKINHF